MAQSTLCDWCALAEHEWQIVRRSNGDTLWLCTSCEYQRMEKTVDATRAAQAEEAAVAVPAGPMTIEEAGPAETPEARPRPQAKVGAPAEGSAGRAQAGEDDPSADDRRGDDRLESGTGGRDEP